MKAGREISIKEKEVIRQLESTHGDQLFSGAAGREMKKNIEASAAAFDTERAIQVSYKLYQLNN